MLSGGELLCSMLKKYIIQKNQNKNKNITFKYWKLMTTALGSIFKYLFRKKRWNTSEKNLQRRTAEIAAMPSDQRKVLGGLSAMSSQEKK